MKFVVASLLAAFALTACGSNPVIDEQHAEASKAGISFRPILIKDKGAKYDIKFAISNLSDKNIIILLSEMSCYRGHMMGILKHTFFNTGERTIDFKAGQMKEFKMVCDYGSKMKGDYKISIRKVYENPNGDGATKGKVITENIDWTLPNN
jgi:hypothetical protein